jgi:hypothetical protein
LREGIGTGHGPDGIGEEFVVKGKAGEVGDGDGETGEKALPDFENVDLGEFDVFLPRGFLIVPDEFMENWDQKSLGELFAVEEIAEDGFVVKGRSSGRGNEEGPIKVKGEALDVGEFGQVGSHSAWLGGKGRK